jgi:hypothetical protein
MTVPSENRRNAYTISDIGSYVYTFGIVKPDELVVEIADENDLNRRQLIYETEYTLTGLGDLEGGDVVLDTAVELAHVDWSMVILLDPPITQLIAFNNQDAFDAVKHETAYDLATKQLLSLKEISDRCLKVPPAGGSTTKGQELNATLEQEVADIGKARDLAVEAAQTFQVLDDDTLGGVAPSTTEPPSQSAAKNYIDAEITGIATYATEGYVDAEVSALEPLDDDTLGGGTPSTTQPPTQSSAKTYADDIVASLGVSLSDLVANDVDPPDTILDTVLGTSYITIAPKARLSLVYLGIYSTAGPVTYNVRTPGDAGDPSYLGGDSSVTYVWMKTNSDGEVEIKCSAATDTRVDLLAWFPLY